MFWEAQVFGNQYCLSSLKLGPSLKLSTGKHVRFPHKYGFLFQYLGKYAYIY